LDMTLELWAFHEKSTLIFFPAARTDTGSLIPTPDFLQVNTQCRLAEK